MYHMLFDSCLFGTRFLFVNSYKAWIEKSRDVDGENFSYHVTTVSFKVFVIVFLITPHDWPYHFGPCWDFDLVENSNSVQNDLVRISVRKIPVRFSKIDNRNQENGLFLDERLFHEKSLVDNNLNRSNVPFVPIANPPLISTYRNLQGFPEWSKIDANSKFVFQF